MKTQAQIDQEQALADYTKATQIDRDRAQAFVDAHASGNADLDMTGQGNSTDPERRTSHLRPLLTNKGERPDWQNPRAADAMAAPVQGSRLGDPFDLSLRETHTTVTPQGAKGPQDKAVTPFAQSTSSRDRSKSPLAMNKSDLGYDPRSHH